MDVLSLAAHICYKLGGEDDGEDDHEDDDDDDDDNYDSDGSPHLLKTWR